MRSTGLAWGVHGFDVSGRMPDVTWGLMDGGGIE